MGHRTTPLQPEKTEHDALIDKITSRGHFLPEEVRGAKLDRYEDKQLEGRLAEYLKLYTFELNPRLRNEFKTEYVRTEAEINRRKHERRNEAIRGAA